MTVKIVTLCFNRSSLLRKFLVGYCTGKYASYGSLQQNLAIAIAIYLHASYVAIAICEYSK